MSEQQGKVEMWRMIRSVLGWAMGSWAATLRLSVVLVVPTVCLVALAQVWVVD